MIHKGMSVWIKTWLSCIQSSKNSPMKDHDPTAATVDRQIMEIPDEMIKVMANMVMSNRKKE